MGEQSIEAPRRRRRVKKEEEGERELGEGDEGRVRRRRQRPAEEENGHEEENGQAPAPSNDPDELRLDSGARVPESEVDAGLMGALMSTAADMGMGTLRRNKERRRSTKHRESSRKSGDLMRSRTRENNVYVEEEQ